LTCKGAYAKIAGIDYESQNDGHYHYYYDDGNDGKSPAVASWWLADNHFQDEIRTRSQRLRVFAFQGRPLVI